MRVYSYNYLYSIYLLLLLEEKFRLAKGKEKLKGGKKKKKISAMGFEMRFILFARGHNHYCNQHASLVCRLLGMFLLYFLLNIRNLVYHS